MAQPLSLSARTPFPPMPPFGLRDGCAAATAASAFADSMHVASNSTLDLIIIWGPGQQDADLQAIRDHAKKLGLRMDVMETAGISIAERERIKDDWYRSGKLGACTQTLVSAHGTAFGPQGRHHLNLSTDGEPTETGAFFSWLRTPPGDLPPGPQVPGWHGIAHPHSCKDGLLAAEMRDKETEWNRGSFVIHAARKKIALHTLRSLAIDICDAISEGRGQPAPLTPVAMAAHAMRIAGDTIYCGGADFDAPLKIGAPRNDEQISMSTIIENLASGLVLELCREPLSRSTDEWLQPGECERLLTAPRELKLKLIHGKLDSLSAIRELLRSSNPNPANPQDNIDVVAHNSVPESRGHEYAPGGSFVRVARRSADGRCHGAGSSCRERRNASPIRLRGRYRSERVRQAVMRIRPGRAAVLRTNQSAVAHRLFPFTSDRRRPMPPTGE